MVAEMPSQATDFQVVGLSMKQVPVQDLVIWDDELIHNIDSHHGLLQQLAQGCKFWDADGEKQLDGNHIKTNENSKTVWDDELQQKDESQDSSVILAADGYEGFNEISLTNMTWDEEMSDVYEGFAQQLDLSSEYMSNKHIQQEV
jgi:hypothetical protein